MELSVHQYSRRAEASLTDEDLHEPRRLGRQFVASAARERPLHVAGSESRADVDAHAAPSSIVLRLRHALATRFLQPSSLTPSMAPVSANERSSQ